MTPKSSHGAVPQSTGAGIGERQRLHKRRKGRRLADLRRTGARNRGREPPTRGEVDFLVVELGKNIHDMVLKMYEGIGISWTLAQIRLDSLMAIEFRR